MKHTSIFQASKLIVKEIAEKQWTSIPIVALSADKLNLTSAHLQSYGMCDSSKELYLSNPLSSKTNSHSRSHKNLHKIWINLVQFHLIRVILANNNLNL